ncbi:hypothetical protein WJ99_19185 [Burkholderia ubonensis]|nr:hypothetical protein WJ99_19185 [Burkholderia ubonensis]KVU82344.1 hypothetical protein WK76_29110 [Burkholderia ubonensis]
MSHVDASSGFTTSLVMLIAKRRTEILFRVREKLAGASFQVGATQELPGWHGEAHTYKLT